MEYREILGIVIPVFFGMLIILQFYEINKHKKKIQMMEKSKDLIYTLNDKVSQSKCTEEVFNNILDASINYIKYATKGSLLMVDNKGDFKYAVLRGYPYELKDVTIKRESVFLYKINNFKETAIIENPSRFDETAFDNKTKELFDKYGALNISCCLTTPIYIDDKLVGILNVDSVNENNIFTYEDVKMMNYIKNELQLSLKNFITKEKLRQIVEYDGFTGLYSMRYFKEILVKQLDNIKEYDKQAVLAFIDVNNFRKINYKHGYDAGDTIIKSIAKAIKDNLNESEVYARYYADRFVILFPDSNKDTVVPKLNNLKKIIKKIYVKNISIEIMIGMCQIDKYNNLTVDKILMTADKDLEENKTR